MYEYWDHGQGRGEVIRERMSEHSTVELLPVIAVLVPRTQIHDAKLVFRCVLLQELVNVLPARSGSDEWFELSKVNRAHL